MLTKKNKTYITYALLALLGLPVIGGCAKMIEEKKFDFIEPESIPDSETGADQWVAGTYSKLLDDMFRWNVFPPALEFDCDYMSGPDWSFGNLGAGNFQNNDYTKMTWEGPYNLIHRANLAIENITPMKTLSEPVKNNAIGQLNFLKAYAYFLLVRAFGEVPIHTITVNAGGDINQPRQPIPTVYAHIIDLLTQAETMMYKNTDAGFQPGRASAGAAASLLAKVYVTMGSGALATGNVNVRGGVPFTMNGTEKVFTSPATFTVSKKQLAGYASLNAQEYFTKARDKALEVINGKYGAYALLPYDQVFLRANRNSSENIWTLQSVAGNANYGVQFSAGYTGTYNAKGNIETGLWWGMRDHWYKLFESKDYRIVRGVMHRWIRQGGDASWGGGSYYPNNEEWTRKAKGYTNSSGTFVPPEAPFNDGANYRSEKSADFLAYLTKYADVSDNKIERTDAAWYFLRFADVLLIYAEAANEVENSGAARAAALAKLNQVRERSNATPHRLSGDGNIDNQVAFRSAVLEERAMELALEGDRRWDLIRWGIYLDVMNRIGGVDEVGVLKSRTDKHLLYPIPNTAVGINTNITTNNPGWN
ncbi:RagB/SusD family nutrient uptake outer membrane protein [Sphingobacterium sp. R2]|uniref:RagB/SusD family nutrient uptake outer membrane protein n=1 Tax=Sphingobacterium sp. R2 TaxID=3112958 RepID=UPI00345D1FA0